jgi:hypothetical protein
LEAVADLDVPMEKLAGLRDPMVQLDTLKVSLDQVARLEEPLKAVGQLSHPLSVLTNLTPAKFIASVIITTLVFFVFLFLTVWGAVRLGSPQPSP